MQIKKGFTLAETLITLGVLGIIAAYSIPTIINSTNKSIYVNGLKKASIILKTATSELLMDNGGTMQNIIAADNNHNEWLARYCTKLNCIKECPIGTVSGNCFANNVKVLHGANFSAWISDFDFNNFAGAILANGMFVVFDAKEGRSCARNLVNISATDVGCGTIFVDINGMKSPNTLGIDIFTFYPYRTGLLPVGVENTDAATFSGAVGSCDVVSANVASGTGCAGKVLIEGKMNY